MFEVHQLAATIRFVQGYRYLDRCGEALVRLDSVLHKDWLPGETTPKAGVMINHMLGMRAIFNTQSLTVQQNEFIDFKIFLDQTCRIFDTLCSVFEISRVISPCLQVIHQKGFPTDDSVAATQELLRLKLCTIRPELLNVMAGKQDATDVVFTTIEPGIWQNAPANWRKRFAATVARQESQLPFDERMFIRRNLLGQKQAETINALMALRKKHPIGSPTALQIDLEETLEGEWAVSDVHLPNLLDHAWSWSEQVQNTVSTIGKN